jgi:hypothetical protein
MLQKPVQLETGAALYRTLCYCPGPLTKGSSCSCRRDPAVHGSPQASSVRRSHPWPRAEVRRAAQWPAAHSAVIIRSPGSTVCCTSHSSLPFFLTSTCYLLPRSVSLGVDLTGILAKQISRQPPSRASMEPTQQEAPQTPGGCGGDHLGVFKAVSLLSYQMGTTVWLS